MHDTESSSSLFTYLRNTSLPYDSWPIPWPGSEPRRQPLSAVRSGARTVRILRFSVILHKSPRISSKYNPPSTLLSQNIFSNKSLKFSEINPQSTPPPTGHRRAPHEPPAARRDALPAAGPSSPGRESERAEGQRERRGAG